MFITAFRRQLLAGTTLLALAVAAPVVQAQTPASTAGTPPPAAVAGPVAWGSRITDLAPDDAVRYGRLANGMRYAIRHNETPKGAASVRLHFGFGSLGESDAERGFAHLIEHMAFNGTTNVKEGEMVKMLERLGLSFGADTNASTGFDATTYLLELPVADAERVDTALFLMREAASEVVFAQSAVDAERGVIEGERRSRDSFGLRQYVDMEAFMTPGAPYSTRLPIGLSDTIGSASAASLRDLYQRYYRPDNATMVIVGDIDPAEIEGKIAKAFGDWQAKGVAGAALPRGTVDLTRAAAFDDFVDPAVPTTARISIMRPYRQDAFTRAELREDMASSIARGIIGRRLRQLANAPGSAILGGALAESEYRDAADGVSMVVVARDGEWRTALTTAEQELRRAVTHGFTPGEVALELAEMETRYRTAAEQAGTRRNDALADNIVATVNEYGYLVSPQTRWAEFQSAKPTLTKAAVDAALKTMVTGSQPLVHVSDKTPITGGAQAIAAAFTSSAQTAVAAPAQDSGKAFAYADWGKPGTIVEDKTIPDLGIRTIRFANNVRLNLKRTDFEQGRLRYSVRVDGGQLRLPDDKPGLGFMMANVSKIAATKAHSANELEQILAGKTVTTGLFVATDAVVAQGATTPADLALQMQTSAAFIADPGFRPEAQSLWANLAPLAAAQLRAQPQTVGSVEAPAVITGGDYRFGIPPGPLLAKLTLDDARAALVPILDDEPIEIGLVGDFDEAAAIAAVAASFGALPQRQLVPAAFTPTPAKFRADRSPVTLTHAGPVEQALAMTTWSTTDDSDYDSVVGLSLLERIMKLMLTEEIREKLGATYGAQVDRMMSSDYPGLGWLTASATVAPERIDDVEAAFAAVAKDLRDNPVSPDLLARARNPALEQIDQSLRDNQWWLGIVDEAQSTPRDLERARIRRARYEAIDPAAIQALARTYLTEAGQLRIRVVSEKLPKG